MEAMRNRWEISVNNGDFPLRKLQQTTQGYHDFRIIYIQCLNTETDSIHLLFFTYGLGRCRHPSRLTLRNSILEYTTRYGLDMLESTGAAPSCYLKLMRLRSSRVSLGQIEPDKKFLFVGYCHVVCWLNMVKHSVGWRNLQLKWFWHSREHNVFEEQAATEVSCILLHMMPAVQRFQWPKGLQSLMRVRKKNRCQVFKDAFSNPILHALHFLRFQCCTIGSHQFSWLVWSWGFCERFQLQQIFPSTKSKLQISDEFLSANPPNTRNAPPISASTCQDGTFKWFWPLQTALAIIHRQCPRLFHLGCIIHPAGNPPTPIATGAGASLHQWCCDCRTADYRFLADVRLTLVRHVWGVLGLACRSYWYLWTSSTFWKEAGARLLHAHAFRWTDHSLIVPQIFNRLSHMKSTVGITCSKPFCLPFSRVAWKHIDQLINANGCKWSFPEMGVP